MLNLNIAPKTVNEMMKRVDERKDEIVWDDLYKDEIAKVMYDFTSKFWLDIGITYAENSSDSWLEATIYVPKLVNETGYNIVLDCDFSSEFDNTKDFVETMLAGEAHAQQILSHFKK